MRAISLAPITHSVFAFNFIEEYFKGNKLPARNDSRKIVTHVV